MKKGNYCPCVSILRRSLVVNVTVPRVSLLYTYRHLAVSYESCPLADILVPPETRTLVPFLWNVFPHGAASLAPPRARDTVVDTLFILCCPSSYSSPSVSILLLSSIVRVFRRYFDSGDIFLTKLSSRSCTTSSSSAPFVLSSFELSHQSTFRSSPCATASNILHGKTSKK